MQQIILASLLACSVFAQQYYQPQPFGQQQQIPSPQENQPTRFSQYNTAYNPNTQNTGYNSNTGYNNNAGYNQQQQTQRTQSSQYNQQYGNNGFSSTPSYYSSTNMNRQFDSQFNSVSTASSVVALAAAAVVFVL